MDEELKKDMEAVLSLFVWPQLSGHSGGLEVIDLDQDGMLWTGMRGECTGRPSADETAKSLVQKELVTRIPQARGVEADSGIDDEIIEETMKLFTHGTDGRTNKNHKSQSNYNDVIFSLPLKDRFVLKPAKPPYPDSTGQGVLSFLRGTLL